MQRVVCITRHIRSTNPRTITPLIKIIRLAAKKVMMKENGSVSP